MSNDTKANSAGGEPRPESGQQLLKRLLASGSGQNDPPETMPATTGPSPSGADLFARLVAAGKDSNTKLVLPMMSERERRELLDKLRAGTPLGNANLREMPNGGPPAVLLAPSGFQKTGLVTTGPLQFIADPFDRLIGVENCRERERRGLYVSMKNAFDSDLDALASLEAWAMSQLRRFRSFALAARNDRPIDAATALRELFQETNWINSTDIFDALFSAHGDNLPRGQMLVPASSYFVQPDQTSTVCKALLWMAANLKGDILIDIGRARQVTAKQVNALTGPAFVDQAVAIWPQIQRHGVWLENACVDLDLKLKLRDEFAAAKLRARLSPSVTGKMPAPWSPAVAKHVEETLKGIATVGAAEDEPAEVETPDDPAGDAILDTEAEKRPAAAPSNGAPVASRLGKEERDALCLSVFNLHHGYNNGNVETHEPISPSKMAAEAKTSRPTVSRWFKDKFQSYKRYKILCHQDRIRDELRRLNGDLRDEKVFDALAVEREKEKKKGNEDE